MRAFLPLLVLGIAARVGRFEISEGYHWLASDAALITFAVAVVAETMADKIPLVDHALDTVQTIVKPAVGTMVAAAMFVQLSPFHATLLGLAVGGTVATGVHLAKAKARVLSSLTTGTALNPVLSFVEDVVSAVIAVVAVLARSSRCCSSRDLRLRVPSPPSALPREPAGHAAARADPLSIAAPVTSRARAAHSPGGHTMNDVHYCAQDLAKFGSIGDHAPALAEKFFAGTARCSPTAPSRRARSRSSRWRWRTPCSAPTASRPTARTRWRRAPTWSR